MCKEETNYFIGLLHKEVCEQLQLKMNITLEKAKETALQHNLSRSKIKVLPHN